MLAPIFIGELLCLPHRRSPGGFASSLLANKCKRAGFSNELQSAYLCSELLLYCTILDYHCHQISESSLRCFELTCEGIKRQRIDVRSPEDGFYIPFDEIDDEPVVTLNEWNTFANAEFAEDDPRHMNRTFSTFEIRALWNMLCARLRLLVSADARALDMPLLDAMKRWGFYWVDHQGQIGCDFASERCVMRISTLTPFIVLQGARTASQIQAAGQAYQKLFSPSGRTWNPDAPFNLNSTLPIHSYESHAMGERNSGQSSSGSGLITTPRGHHSSQAIASPRRASLELTQPGLFLPTVMGTTSGNLSPSPSASGIYEDIASICGGSDKRPLKPHSQNITVTMSSYYRLIWMMMIQVITRSYGLGCSATNPISLETLTQSYRRLLEVNASTKPGILGFLGDALTTPLASTSLHKMTILRAFFTIVMTNQEVEGITIFEALSAPVTTTSQLDEASIAHLQSIEFANELIHWWPTPIIDVLSPANSAMHREASHPALISRLNVIRKRNQRDPVNSYIPSYSDNSELLASQRKTQVDPKVLASLIGLAPWFVISGLKRYHVEATEVVPAAFRDLLTKLTMSSPCYYRQIALPRVTVANCTESTVFIREPIGDLIITDCHRCTIIALTVHGQLLINSSSRLRISVVSHSVHLDNCYDINLRPITSSNTLFTGDTRGCRIGAFEVLAPGLSAILKTIGMPYSHDVVTSSARRFILLSVTHQMDERFLPTDSMKPHSPETTMSDAHGMSRDDDTVIIDDDSLDPIMIDAHTWGRREGSPWESFITTSIHAEKVMAATDAKVKSLQVVSAAMRIDPNDVSDQRDKKVVGAVEALFMNWLRHEDGRYKELHDLQNTAQYSMI